MKIGIVGGGISGLGAALALSQDHEVTVFEKEKRVGGHSCTPEIEVGGKITPVDVAFVAFSPPVYKNLTKLFSYLDIETNQMAMSWSVSTNNRKFEYSVRNLFVDWKNLFRLSFWVFLLEIVKFIFVARDTIKQKNVGVRSKHFWRLRIQYFIRCLAV